jgi:hypothetical protein
LNIGVTEILDNFVCLRFIHTHVGPVWRFAAGWNLRGGELFCTRPDLSWGLFSLLYNEYRIIPRGNGARLGVNHPPSSSVEVKERE